MDSLLKIIFHEIDFRLHYVRIHRKFTQNQLMNKFSRDYN
jgi:hypothetical protein